MEISLEKGYLWLLKETDNVKMYRESLPGRGNMCLLATDVMYGNEVGYESGSKSVTARSYAIHR